MKKKIPLLLSLFIITSMLLTFCRDKDKSDPSQTFSDSAPKKRTYFDTTRIIAAVVTPERNNIVHEVLFRLTFDSVQKAIPTGDNTFKVGWGIDTMYFYPKLDTIRDSVTRKPIFDAAGRVSYRTDWREHPKAFIWDKDMNVDTAQKMLIPFLTDTARKK